MHKINLASPYSPSATTVIRHASV